MKNKSEWATMLQRSLNMLSWHERKPSFRESPHRVITLLYKLFVEPLP